MEELFLHHSSPTHNHGSRQRTHECSVTNMLPSLKLFALASPKWHFLEAVTTVLDTPAGRAEVDAVRKYYFPACTARVKKKRKSVHISSKSHVNPSE